MKRRAFLAGSLGAACGAALPAFGMSRDGVLTATDVHVKDYPTVVAVRWIGEQLENRTGGRIRIRQYHSGQLGRESEAIDMARFGAMPSTRRPFTLCMVPGPAAGTGAGTRTSAASVTTRLAAKAP